MATTAINPDIQPAGLVFCQSILEIVGQSQNQSVGDLMKITYLMNMTSCLVLIC